MFRWRFLKSPALKKFYDFLTFLVTSLFTGYGGVAFLVQSNDNLSHGN